MACCSKKAVIQQIIRPANADQNMSQPKPLIIRVDQSRNVANIQPSQVDVHRVDK